jgi:uncharacterized protein (UPF0261 family)
VNKIAVLVTLDSKAEAAAFMCKSLWQLGVEPWLVDLSLKPHKHKEANVGGNYVADRSGTTWEEMAEMDRAEAGKAMIQGGIHILLEAFESGDISGVVGLGGANGCTVFCSMMRALPPLFPKVMVTPVAAPAGVQWYVAESDIVMFPTIGDIVINSITKSIMENACFAIDGMANAWQRRKTIKTKSLPLIGVSSFGNLQECIDRVTVQLEGHGFEVMHFHASGPGGKALESLAGRRELAGVMDITTSELCDILNDGVYRSGDNRLTQAGAAGLPQVVAPGALDHTNWWVGQCPEKFHNREFFKYNLEILLMRTNEEEMNKLGVMFAERLNAATGPLTVMIPNRGFSQHVIRKTYDINGFEIGNWFKPETDKCFTEAVRANLKNGAVKEFDLHINDKEFADACVEEFMQLMKKI